MVTVWLPFGVWAVLAVVVGVLHGEDVLATACRDVNVDVMDDNVEVVVDAVAVLKFRPKSIRFISVGSTHARLRVGPRHARQP